MRLRELYLYPDLVDYEKEIVHPFRDQSRSICNYLERKLREIKFDAKGFKRICFIGKNKLDLECYINSSKVLIVEIPFDKRKYKSLKRDQLNLFFSQMLVKGIKRCQKHYNIPESELLDGIERFCKSNGRNKWVFKTKRFKEVAIKCSLQCELTVDAFYLNLVLIKGKEVVFNREILKTVPDEIVFTPMFKGINIVADHIVVSDKFGDNIFSVKISELSI